MKAMHHLNQPDDPKIILPISTAELLHFWQILKQVSNRQQELDTVRQQLAFLKNEQSRLTRQLPEDLLALSSDDALQQIASLSSQQDQQFQSAEEWSLVTEKLHQNIQMLRLVLIELGHLAQYSVKWQTWFEKTETIDQELVSKSPESLLQLWRDYGDLQTQIIALREELNEWFNIEAQLTAPVLVNVTRWTAMIKQLQGQIAQHPNYDSKELYESLHKEVDSYVLAVLSHNAGEPPEKH